jgi:hypothetical protein
MIGSGGFYFVFSAVPAIPNVAALGVGGLLGGVYGVWICIHDLAPIFFPESFKVYASETQTPAPVVERKVIEQYFVINLEGAAHRVSFCGMTPEQWQELGNLVVRSGYKYKQPYFENVVGDREKGRLAYDKASARLNYNDVFLLVYGNGYKLTEAGEELFDKLAAGDWRVLDELEND